VEDFSAVGVGTTELELDPSGVEVGNEVGL